MVLNVDLKQQWTAALRSGAYVQGAEHFCADGKYCCLGVLARVAFPDDMIEEHRDGDDEYLDPDSLRAVGMEQDTQRTLASMNDGTPQQPRQTFSQIADWIDVNL